MARNIINTKDLGKAAAALFTTMRQPELTIEITGTGTRENLANALRRFADCIHHPTSKGDELNMPIEELSGYFGRYCELKTNVSV